MRILGRATLVLVSLGVACTAPQELPSASPSPTTTGRAPVPEVVASSQPVSDYVSFIDALTAAGFDVRQGERAGDDQIFPAGQIVIIDGVQTSTYEYPSERALQDFRASISDDGYSIPMQNGGVAMVEWVEPPHLYGAGSLLVVYLGDKQRMLDALDLVLGPQFAGATPS